MKVLVTGAHGFIGTNIVQQLIEAGHSVKAMDNVRGGHLAAGVDAITGDVTDPDTCRAACRGVDVVIHGAAIHHIEKVASGPLRVLDVNVAGTLNVLRAAADQGVGKLVFLSSAKIYGEPASIPSEETDFPQPIEIYALSKLAGEHYCRLIHDSTELPIVIVRLFSVYGPGQSLDTGYVGMLLEARISGRALEFPGRADFVRDFVHVGDVTRLCVELATGSLPGLSVVNAGSGTSCTLAELVALTNQVIGGALAAQYRVPRPETIKRSQAAMRLAEDLLGFTPEISLAEGLRQTNDWFKQAKAAGMTKK